MVLSDFQLNLFHMQLFFFPFLFLVLYLKTHSHLKCKYQEQTLCKVLYKEQYQTMRNITMWYLFTIHYFPLILPVKYHSNQYVYFHFHILRQNFLALSLHIFKVHLVGTVISNIWKTDLFSMGLTSIEQFFKKLKHYYNLLPLWNFVRIFYLTLILHLFPK
jgi:hypothetical protein